MKEVALAGDPLPVYVTLTDKPESINLINTTTEIVNVRIFEAFSATMRVCVQSGQDIRAVCLCV